MKITQRIFVLFLLFVVVIASTSYYAPNDPTTWSPNELKEWLAEHRISYKGIPEKQELIEMVKANWRDFKGRANSTTEAVESFVTGYINTIKDSYNDLQEPEKYDEFLQETASQIESIRQSTGLTEEQAQTTIDEITKKIKAKKVEGHKELTKALNEIKKSYSMAKARRDVLIQKITNRVQDDLIEAGEVSQDTLDWFKEEINKLGEDGSFAKARIETQISLVVQGVQEQLTKRKLTTVDQINSVYEKLNSVTIKGTLDRLRQQLFFVNEKIQNSVDAIGQKLSDGKTLTIDQLQQIRLTVNNYYTAVKDYYNACTGHVKDTVSETKRSQEERLNKIIEAVRSSINDARTTSNKKISQITKSVEENIASTQQLTAEQTKILSETIQEKLGNLKDSRDLTEDNVNSFVETLRTRMTDARDYVTDTYDAATQKVEKGYNAAYNTVSDGAESVSESIQEGYKKAKEQLTPKHDKQEL